MTTNINVTEQTTTVTTVDDVTTITLNNAGVQGIPGVGYTGVTSTSTITIGAGLKTFTLVSGYAGAFITGMRIRAIHSDTPTYYLEGTANYVGAGTLIITVDKFNGSGSHNLWAFASAGEVGQTGATGASGVVSVTSPITNTGTAGSAIVGIDQTLLALSQSQVTNLTSDLALKAPLASPTFSGTVTFPFTNSGIVHSGTAGVMQVSAAAPGVGYIPYTGSTAGGYLWQDISLVARDNTANAFTVGGHTITNDAVGTVPISIVPIAGQTASNFRVRNSSNTSDIFNIASGGGFYAQSANLGTGPGVGVLSLQPYSASTIGAVIRGAASQSANLQEWQNSAGTVLARVAASGSILGQTVQTINGSTIMREGFSGGVFEAAKSTAAQNNPGSGIGRIYFRDGTNSGTLKLVVRAGAAGAETTILDNIPQT